MLTDTTRNAKTPPNFEPKLYSKLTRKLPNVSSESVENTFFHAAWWGARLEKRGGTRLKGLLSHTCKSNADGHHSKRQNTTEFRAKPVFKAHQKNSLTCRLNP